MSALLTGRAMRTKIGDRSAKQILEHLCNYADENDRAWPSVSTLADECECSTSTVQRALRFLESRGLIAKDENYGTRYGSDRSPYVYLILLDDAEQITYTRRRAKEKAAARAKAKERGSTHDTPRGSTHDTPRGSTHDTPRGSTHDTNGVSPTPPRGVSPMHERGVTHDTQTVKEHSLRTSRESTRANKPAKPAIAGRLQALADLKPDPTHLALAAEAGLDVGLELAKFRDRVLATGDYPADPAAAFRNWLRRGRELNLGRQATGGGDSSEASELDRRARKLLDSSTPLKRRRPDREQRARWLPAVKAMLARGMSPVDVVTALTDGDPALFEDLGIPVDDLDQVA